MPELKRSSQEHPFVTRAKRARATNNALGHARRLVIMVKEPIAGRVKTRLAVETSTPRATRFYRHNLRTVIARLSADPRWNTQLSVAPAIAVGSRLLPRWPARHIAQATGDIGTRMQTIFDQSGPGPVVVIGTDIPAIRRAHINAAFQALGSHDIVFGPALDGGFWLVGMRRTPKLIQAFSAVRWSSANTLQDCLNGLQPDLRVAMVETLSDADEAVDFKKLDALIGRQILPLTFKTDLR